MNKLNIVNKADWELKAIIKALSMLPLLNTKEEDERLAEAKQILKNRQK